MWPGSVEYTHTHTHIRRAANGTNRRSVKWHHTIKASIANKHLWEKREREKKRWTVLAKWKKMDNRTNKTQQNNRKLVSSFLFDVQSIRRCIAIVSSAWRRCRVGFNINWCWDERYRKIDWHQVNRTHMSHDKRREKERESGRFGGAAWPSDYMRNERCWCSIIRWILIEPSQMHT